MVRGMIRRALPTPPRPGETESEFLDRCEAAGGTAAGCAQMWTDAQGIAPRGIPLRPDFNAQRERTMTSIARAALVVAKSCRDHYAHQAIRGDRLAELVLRSPVAPTSTADAAALQTIVVAFVASLVPISAAAAVLQRSLQLSFDGAGQIRIPALTLPNAVWKGEGAPIPVSQGVSSPGATIEPYKLATAVALTGELIRNSNAEALVHQVLIENVGPTLDLALFSAVAEAPGIRPGGILNGIAPLAASTTMVKDIAQIAEALAPCSGNAGAILVAAPAQYVALTMGALRSPFPIYQSAALPAGSVIGLVPTAIASVVEAPRIEASSESVMHLDTAPLDIGLPGTPTTVAARSISMFQADSVAIRFILPATWARRSAAAVAWVQAVTW
jgi:Phage capsid family